MQSESELTAEHEPDVGRMSAQEFVEWMLHEPDPIPLASFPLQTNEGRCEFLREYLRRGDVAQFEAIAHIWSSLNEPRHQRCTAIGVAAGTGGQGKVALVNLLSAVLSEVMTINAVLPKAADFDSVDVWHRAVMASFREEELETDKVLQKYADFLNGAPPSPPSLAATLRRPLDGQKEPSG